MDNDTAIDYSKIVSGGRVFPIRYEEDKSCVYAIVNIDGREIKKYGNKILDGFEGAKDSAYRAMEIYLQIQDNWQAN